MKQIEENRRMSRAVSCSLREIDWKFYQKVQRITLEDPLLILLKPIIHYSTK